MKLMDSTINALIPKYSNKPKLEYVNTEIAMQTLGITSPTTLQKFRDEGNLEYVKLSQKHVLYSWESIQNFIKSKSKRTF